MAAGIQRALGVAALAWLINSCGPDAVDNPTSDRAAETPAEKPWPLARVTDYSSAYHLGVLRSVGVDDAYNLWLLDYDSRLGVLRPGDSGPRWATGLGQAGRGFPAYTLCGGSANHAYVGYVARNPNGPGSPTPGPTQGDADLLRVEPDGTLSVEQHLVLVHPSGPRDGETRSVLTCAKVMRGPGKGDLYFGTNRAVTRVRGTASSDACQPRGAETRGPPRSGYTFAVSITQDGGVFLGDERSVGLLAPPPRPKESADCGLTPWKLTPHASPLGPPEELDSWRATAQTVDRRYYAGSLNKGLWEVSLSPRRVTEVTLGTRSINALAATDDGSLFIGTGNLGLWRLKPDKTLERFDAVPGARVTQLVYDPTVQPSMLYALSDGRLYVARGY